MYRLLRRKNISTDADNGFQGKRYDSKAKALPRLPMPTRQNAKSYSVALVLCLVLCFVLLNAARMFLFRNLLGSGARTYQNYELAFVNKSTAMRQLDSNMMITASHRINLREHEKFITRLMTVMDKEISHCNYTRGNALNLCCLFRKRNMMRCFPSLIGIGAQKSGSTVLFARMMVDSRIYQGDKKEHHFFDFDDRWVYGASMYLRSFSQLGQQQIYEGIAAEYTPSYILPRMAMRRMRNLLPHARLLMVVRDPVDRAWSEIQMKLRNDEALVAYTQTLMANQDITSCFVKANATRFDKVFKTCVPKKLQRNSRAFSFQMRATRFFRNTTRVNDCIDQLKLSDSPGETWTHCMIVPPQNMIALEDDEHDIVQDLYKERSMLANCFKTQQRLCHGMANRKPSDISTDYLYRGLYAYHIDECWRWFPKEQLLVVENEEVKSEPDAVMQKILRHAGLPPVDAGNDEDAWKEFRKHYPGFEDSTGWKHSKPMPDIPPKVRDFLLYFYEKPSQRLEELIGRKFPHWQKPERLE
uniref:Sulfotransferase domain-containing protein n=1 Tax=Rhodosorus marinus TaxID=101924 RepID=A0A7S0G0N9_9RHOD|mmetsp:Transcript_11600/g.16764  ORF Transcript_11600/g.16764 Transcript_11600/m.16764 type:complete len:528 (+) Transcript_11600:191-1774(+)